MVPDAVVDEKAVIVDESEKYGSKLVSFTDKAFIELIVPRPEGRK